MLRRIIAKRHGEEVYLCETGDGHFQVIDAKAGKRHRKLARTDLEIKDERWMLMASPPFGLLERLSSFPQA